MTSMSINSRPPFLPPKPSLSRRNDWPGVDAARADRSSARVLLKRVRDPPGCARDREYRLSGPWDHACHDRERGEREVNVRLWQRAPARLRDHRVRYGEAFRARI